MLEVEDQMDISEDKENDEILDSTTTSIPGKSHTSVQTCNVMDHYKFKPFTFTEIKASSKSKFPAPRSGHRSVCTDSSLYSLGGYLETATVQKIGRHRMQSSIRKKVFKQLYKFNFCDQNWRIVQTEGKFPSGLASPTTVLHGNHLVVFGGTSLPFGEVLSNTVDICDLRTTLWKRLSTHGMDPGGVYGHSTILDEENKCLYTVGGTTGYRYFIDIYKLNLVDGEWESLFVSQGDILDTGEPTPRYRHETAFDGTLIYLFGGGKPTCSETFTNIPVFNVRTCLWSSKETKGDDVHLYPTSRKCHGLIQTNDNVWMTGGENENELFDEFWNLHLPTLKWSKMTAKLPTELSFHSVSITSQGCMYIFGGVNKIHQDGPEAVFKERTNSLFKMWLKVPTLKELCWEALLHYDCNNSIKTSSSNDLIAKGIPREFVARVYD